MEEKIRRSEVSSIEYGLIIGVLLFVDIIQVGLDFFAIGVVINRFLDIVVGGALLLFLFLRGELKNSQTRKRLLTAFFATVITEEIPILDIAPAWTFDGWYCWKQSVVINKLADEQEQRQAGEDQQNKLQTQQEKIFRLQSIRQEQQEENELYEEAA